jgi:hypothetical protein
VALHEVTLDGVARPDRQLDVDGAPRGELAQGRALRGLGRDVGAELVVADLDHRHAHARDRHRAARRELRARLRRLHAQRPPVRRDDAAHFHDESPIHALYLLRLR